MKVDLERLRRQAITTSLFRPTTLRQAIQRLGFVQADPIRSPAHAQDLILRHRVKDYRTGDLEERYPSLDVEEDFLYAYGFMPQSTWRLLHPRLETKLSSAEKQVLAIVSKHKQIHPRELESYLGRERALGPWGSYSRATTRSLQALHYRGVLRIAGRKNGIRLYAATSKRQDEIEPTERLRQLVLLIARILAPLPERSLYAALHLLAYSSPFAKGGRQQVAELLTSGELASAEVQGLRYVWPADRRARRTVEERVRFLAPFDPLVWDRRRFEHFWGWAYRFEAYTPAPKRKLGYYALPLLWRDDIVGWVNITNRRDGFKVTPGFVKAPPTERLFHTRFEEEVESFRYFLR